MSKIVRAINSMISNADMINSVISTSSSDIHDSEIFFLYGENHKWSMNNSVDAGNQNYNLFYYRTDMSLIQLSRISDEEWDHLDIFVRYSSKSIGTKEAAQSFQELYLLLKEKLLGMDDVLDEIISTDW